MKILVTGGLGFIGSHTVVELIAGKYQVVIVDNLVNSKIGVLDKLEEIYPGFRKFKTIRKFDPEAYFYWYKSIELLSLKEVISEREVSVLPTT